MTSALDKYFSSGEDNVPNPSSRSELDKYFSSASQTDDPGQFIAGVKTGVDQVQGLGGGLVALFGDAVDSDTIRDWGMETYQRNNEEAQQNGLRVQRIEDIHSVGDFSDWAAGTIGQLAPTMATMVGTGGAAGVLAGLVGRQATKKLTATIADKSISKAVKTKAMQDMAKVITKRQTAQMGGALAGSMGMETGEIYGDVAAEGAEGAGAIASSMAGGTLAGLLDALPLLRLGRKFGFAGELKKSIAKKQAEMSLVKRIGSEGAIQAGIEGSTEGIQTAIEEGTKAFILERNLPEDMASILMNAVAAGTLGGGAMGSVAGIAKPNTPTDAQPHPAGNGNTPPASTATTETPTSTATVEGTNAQSMADELEARLNPDNIARNMATDQAEHDALDEVDDAINAGHHGKIAEVQAYEAKRQQREVAEAQQSQAESGLREQQNAAYALPADHPYLTGVISDADLTVLAESGNQDAQNAIMLKQQLSATNEENALQLASGEHGEAVVRPVAPTIEKTKDGRLQIKGTMESTIATLREYGIKFAASGKNKLVIVAQKDAERANSVLAPSGADYASLPVVNLPQGDLGAVEKPKPITVDDGTNPNADAEATARFETEAANNRTISPTPRTLPAVAEKESSLDAPKLTPIDLPTNRGGYAITPHNQRLSADTQAEAMALAGNNPEFKAVVQDGKYVLRTVKAIKFEAARNAQQAAAKVEQQRQTVQPNADIHDYLRSIGGVNTAPGSTYAGEFSKNSSIHNKGKGKVLFAGAANDADYAAQLAHQEGYIDSPTPEALLEAVELGRGESFTKAHQSERDTKAAEYDGLIVKDDGNPYANKSTATLAIKKKKLEGYEPVEVGGGKFALSPIATTSHVETVSDATVKTPYDAVSRLEKIGEGKPPESRDGHITANRVKANARKKAAADFIENYNNTPFTVSNGTLKVMVTQSAKEPGRWQASVFQPDGTPSGDSIKDTFAEIVESLRADGFDLSKAKPAQPAETQKQVTSERDFDGGRLVANVEDNRLQAFFDEKPNEEMRGKLKSNGFRWSPKNGAWQRQLTDNAVYAARRLFTGIKETDKGDALHSKGKSTTGQTVAKTEQDLISTFGSRMKRAIEKGKVVILRTSINAPDGVKRMVAYHGSPYDHNKFKNEHVGGNYVIFDDTDISTAAKFSKNGNIQGWYDKDGTINIVAENNDTGSLAGVVLHEAKHAFDDSAKGKAILEKSIKQIKQSKDLAKSGRGKVAEWISDAESAIPSDTPAKDYYHEIFAYAVQQYHDNMAALPNTIKNIVERYVDALTGFIRAHLLKTGINVKVTPAALASLARSELNSMGKSESVLSGENAYASIAKEYGISGAEAKRQFDAVVAKYKGTAQWLKAPNGRPTKLNERQWVQVRTEAFKEWFGDWEHDAKNASEVVDENDEPLVVYHGGSEGITSFDMAHYKEGEGGGGFGYGLHFAENKEYAGEYAANSHEINIDGEIIRGNNKRFPIAKELIGSNYSDMLAAFNLYAEKHPERPFAKERIKILKSLKHSDIKDVSREPHVYSVFLNIPHGTSIDWDSSNQSENVMDVIPSGNMTGGEAYSELEHSFGSEQDAADYLKSMGIKGIKYQMPFNLGNIEHEKGAYTILDPFDIKSATDNTGQFNKDNADIRYSRASSASESVASGNLGLPEETRTDKFVKYFQDGFNRIKKVQEHIKATGGKVDESNDVYRAEERSSGKITARLDDLDSDHVKPLLDAMRESGIELDVLDAYLIAKHAEERNEYIASINPDQQDGGSGITTKDAQATLRGFEDAGQTKALEELAGRVYAINNKAIQDMLDGSLIDKETANLWQNQYKYYVPLKGKSGEESGGGTGRGYEVRNSGVKAAMGRGAGNMAESPLAHSIAQAESGIVRAEKMVVGHHLAKLALDNPDPSLWTVTKSNYVKFQELDGEIGEGFSKPPVEMIEGRDYHRVAGITPADAAAYRKARKDYAEGKGDKPTRPSTKVYFRVDPQYNNRDDVFTTLIKGQRYSIHIKDQVMAEQMKKLTASQLNAVVQHAGVLNRYLAMINTALNPEFVITNFERDFTTAGINMGGEHGKKMAWEMVKATPAAMNGIRNYLFGDGKNEWAKIYNEMRHAGGTIGFFGLEDNEAKIVNINKRLHNNDANAWATTKRGFRAVRDKVMDANSVIENATRLAAYKVAIDNGMTKNQAASLAKNLTVNFNRKGELGPAMNSAYLFFNASIQGSARIFSALKHPATQKIVAGVAAAGFGLAAYNMEAGGDDDDGVSRWEKVPDYIKQTHIVIMQDDGTYLKYKLPYGYNAFWYAGVALHDLAYGKNTTTISTAMNLATAVLNAYNPMAGSDILDTVTPTALKPLEQHIRNANFMGSQIKPENKFDLDNKPDSSKAFRSTNPYLKAFVQELNSITGGDENHAGLIDVSPETLKHYVGWVTGGAGMTVFRTGDTLANFAAGEEIEQRGVPLWRTFGGEVSTRYDSNRYYDMLDELKATKKQFDLLKNTDIGEAIIYREKNMSELRKQRQIYKTNKRIKLLRNMKDAAEKRRDSGAAKRYGEQIARIMRRFTAN